MTTVLKIPKAAVSMQHGTLAQWLVADGAMVAEGQPIYTLEIEKSTMDVEAPAAGILKQVARVGIEYQVGEVVGEICAMTATESASKPVVVAPSGIYHSGYVVADIQSAVRHWVEQAGAGPFALFDDFTFVNPVYRGKAGGPSVALAFAYSGDSCIELIQPKNSDPSIYSETSGALHHVGIGVPILNAAVASYEAAGVTCAFKAEFPFGGGCAYLDTVGTLGVFTELVEMGPIVEGMLEQMRIAHRNWNRRDYTFTLA
ncbi:MAG: VOC family protein [Pseudomonadales bacterium]|nr:VOC family protein [Pseudomonadales bacterium]